MKTPAQLVTVPVCLACSLQPSALFAQGSLIPPGAPAPTMKTLAQIEPRTPISAAPFTITAPGSYYLTTNLTVSSGDAIVIATNGVTLDLSGFTIASTAASATGMAVRINGGLCNIRILNGFIQGGVTNAGGTFQGPGFQHGIAYSWPLPANVTVCGVQVSGCLDNGIDLGLNSAVESCSVRLVGGYGISATIVKDSKALDCGRTAISGRQVSNSRGESISSGYGIDASTALNCEGSSRNSVGLSAETALNCYGSSQSQGLFAGRTAQNCVGYGGTGQGVAAQMAINCYGYSDSGFGVQANTAQNCVGYSSSGAGVYADIAIGCFGCSGSGPGIQAFIANSCRVWCGSANITHKYNMP